MISVAASIVYAGIFLAFGAALCRKLLPQADWQERTVFTCAFGLAGLCALPALAALVLGFTLPAALAAATAALALAGWCWFTAPPNNQRPGFTPAFWLCVVPLALFSFWLLHTHTLYFKDGVYWCGQSTYGDLPMHLSFITSIANQGSFPPYSPLMAGKEMFGYPFLCESVSSVFLLLGAPLKLACLLPQFVAFVSVLGGGWLLADHLLRSSTKASLAYWLFFMGSGFGFAYFMNGDWQNFTRIFTAFYETPTNYVQENIRWVNPIADLLIPQRATLFGWALLLPCLTLLVDFWASRAHRLWPGLFILAACLPLVHTHSALALVLICLVLFAQQLAASRFNLKAVQGWLCFGIATGLVWIPLMASQILPSTSQGSGFLRLHFNWANEGDSYFWFYIKNIGLVYLLLIPAFLWAGRKLRWVYGGGLLILLLSEFVVFQPNNYDNNKLLFIWHLLGCILVANLVVDLLALVPKLWVKRYLACGFVVVCTLGSVLTLGREAVSRYQHFSADGIAMARYVEENTSPTALFLTGTQHINPVLSLSGRSVVCSADLWLYFHGRDTQEKKQAVRTLYESPSLEGLHEWGVGYVVISSWERSDYQVQEDWFQQNCTLLYQSGEYQLYQVPAL